MATRKVTTKIDMHPCPKCGNRRDFKIVAEQVAEDLCEVWVECKCGHAPDACRFEDVWGSVGNENSNYALGFWNEVHQPLTTEESEADRGE